MNRLRKIYSDKKFGEFKEQYINAHKEITIVTNDGKKIRVDAIVTDKDGNVILQEYKSSETASYTENQEKGFPEMRDSGGRVVDDGKEEFTEGFVIPSGTQVEIVRPEGSKYLMTNREGA